MTKSTNMIAGALLAVVAIGGCQDAANPSADTASIELPAGAIYVSDAAAFSDAMKTAEPGDTIVLANGVWMDFDALVHAEGTSDAPITVAAETPGKVILSGQSSLRLAGQYVVVSGLVFKDGYTPRSEVISFRKDAETLAFNSRVTNTVIDGYSNPNRTQRDLWVGLYGQNNVFDSNHLVGKQNAGPTLAVRLNSEDSQQNGHRIALNYFGPRPVFGSNGGETFRIGTSHYSMTQSLTLVENNYFDRCSGEVEIASNKSGGNTFRGNTFYASRGTLTLRHGNGTIIENNLFDGAGAAYTGGVRVINANQTIRNNYFKDLTGNRFSGALVVMNGVPNSPINRYHQVDGAVIENNTFDNVRAIELGEGSDAERTAVPINSVFSDNLVVGDKADGPFNLYDDMSGIGFSENYASGASPEEIGAGFEVRSDFARSDESGRIAPVEDAGASGQFGVDRDLTGVDWYPKPSEGSPFEQTREIALSPGTDVLSAAMATTEQGDHFVLAPGEYRESKLITLDEAVTVRAAAGGSPTVSFERPHLFVLTGNGALALDGVTVSGKAAPDGKGNSLVTSSSERGSGNHTVRLENVRIEDFDVNRGFSVVSAQKGSFFDLIHVENSHFENVSGTAFKLDPETDDYGIYNSEFLTIVDSTFENIGGTVASVYRGGRDESTFGPHVDVSGSTFSNVGNQSEPLMVLHGIQKGSFIGNQVTGAAPLAITLTTGLPVFAMESNSVDGTAASDFSVVTDLRNRK